MAREAAKLPSASPADAPRAGTDAKVHATRSVFTITGMDCADCARNIERQVARVPGVRTTSVNFLAARLSVEADVSEPELDRTVLRAVQEAG